MNVFGGIEGQERICRYLQAALDSGRTTHAYLLAGSETGAADAVARRFAAALVAGGQQSVFEEACRGPHPDLHLMEPQGTGGYLVEQVRELVRDAELAPIRALHKVYILKAADKLLGAPANALLKTLEEPPHDVVCILLAQHEHAVLETVRSRCEVLRLRAAAHSQPADEEVFSLLFGVVTGADNRQVLAAAKRMVELAGEGDEDLEAAHAERLEADSEFLTAGARREIEARHKREATTRQRKALAAEVAAVRSWLRDCLLVSQGAPELVAHAEWSAQTMQVGTSASTARLLAALEAASACDERISYNVTPQLAIEALLFEIREAVCQ